MFRKPKLLVVLLLGGLFIAMTAFIERNGKKPSQRLPKPNVIGDVKYLNANNLSIPFENNGVIADASDGLAGPLHGTGGEFPAGSDLHFLFSSGFFVSGLVDGQLWASGVATASRVQDYTEGPAGSDPGDAAARIYVITSSDAPGSDAYVRWADAVAQGADYVDVDGNGSYNPAVDKPDLLGDQMLWFVISDGVPTGNRQWSSGRIIGMEIHVTAWAFARGGALGNIAFIRFRLVNKGTKSISDMYFTSWHDPDVGEFTNDLVGCDTTLSAGYTYNEGADIGAAGYGVEAPVFLVDFFQGPIVDGAPSDTARRVLGPNLGIQKLPGKKVLGLSSFSQYIQSDPSLGDPDTQQEARNYMTGLTQQGLKFDPLVRGVGGTAQDNPRFWYSGDPVAGTGWRQTGGDDQRMLLNTGPFAMNPGDIQDIVTGFVVGRGTDHLNSITVAKQIDVLAQDVYDNNFDIAGPPPPVKVIARSGKDEQGKIFVDLLWDASKQVNDRQLKAGADQQFEGFIVKQFRSQSPSDVEGGVENSRVIARYDLANDIGNLYIDTDEGRVLKFPAVGNLNQADLTNELGAHLRLRLSTDAFTNQPFRLGSPYFFGVVGYNVNHNNIQPNDNTPNIADDWTAPVASDILENSLTDGLNFVNIVPGTAENLDIAFGRPAQRTAGASDGTVTWEVVDPVKVTGHDYEVSFFEDAGQTLWRVTDLNTQQPVLDRQASQSGEYNFPVVDGIMVRVGGPPPHAKSWDFSLGSGRDERWITGIGWASHADVLFGGIDFIGADGPSALFARRSSSLAKDMKTVEIRFSGTTTQKAYRYLRNAQVAPADPSYVPFIVNTSGTYAYQDAREVPFTVWEVDATDGDPAPKQLTVGFLENNEAPPDAGLVDGQWGPTADADLGGREILWIFPEAYDATMSQAKYQANVLTNNWFDAMYAIWAFQRRPPNPVWGEGDVLTVIANHINNPSDRFKISTAASTVANTKSLQQSNFANANVFPNPYLANNPLESASAAEVQFVTFTHLPNKAKLKIFTLSGKLIRELEKDDANTFLRWDLNNAFNLKVASGLYLVHIEAPEIGMQKILKVAVIQRESRLQRF